MRTRNAIDRLAAAGRPLLAHADALVDGNEQKRVLERILASDRSTGRRRRPIGFAFVAAAVIGAVAAAVATHGNAAPRPGTSGGHHPVALTGVQIQAAGYHFKTPAGFAAAEGCAGSNPTPPDGPETPARAMRAAASADGGCLFLFFILPQAGTPPHFGGTPVDVGAYQGYYVAPNDAGESTLYIALPRADPAANGPAYLGLQAQGLTEDQLIAVAQSGLPSSP